MESTQVHHHDAWDRRKMIGQKAPFKPKEIWSIRLGLEMQGRLRELTLSRAAAASSAVPVVLSPVKSTVPYWAGVALTV